MKVAIVLGIAAFVVYTASAINISDIIEEEWNLFKVCKKNS